MKPVSPDHALDYELVRDMVWKAIGYGKPAAGSLEAKIKPGSWVVMKPNYCYLPGQPMYRTGDVTDIRVLRAVMEYLARNSQSQAHHHRGGRKLPELEGSEERQQRGHTEWPAVDLPTPDWGTDDFPGRGRHLGGHAERIRRSNIPNKTFDYVDLAYDVVRDASGNMLALPVPVRNGVGSFSRKTEYFVTNTITSAIS